MNFKQITHLVYASAAVIALTMGLLHWRLISSANQSLAAVQSEITLMQQRLAVDTVHQQLDSLHDQLARQQAAVPSNREVAPIIETLARDLHAMGVKERSINTEPVTQTGHIIHTPLMVNFRSSFQTVFNWLEQVQQYDRLVRVERLILRRETTLNDRDEVLSVSARLIVFGHAQEVAP